MMILTLDNLAYRYNCLPSEALERATTLDLYVLDVSTKWAKYRQDIAEGRTVDHGLKQDELKAMLANVRSG